MLRGGAKGLRGLPGLVWLLGLASLLNDVSSEAIFPLLPLFLAELGGGVRTLGLIEGAADAAAAAAKVLAGRLSDTGPRRLLVVGGYAVPAVARAAIAAALAPWHVLAARVADRLGKGIRSGPRDALLADAAPPRDTGRAFGLQRSMDHLGAALGPLLAAGLVAAGAPLRVTFAVAAAAGLAAPVLLALRLRDPRAPSPRPSPPQSGGEGDSTATPAHPERSVAEGTPTPTPTATPTATATPTPTATPTATAEEVSLSPRTAGGEGRGEGGTGAPTLPPPLRAYVAVAALFALANSTDAFLLVRAREAGVPEAAVPLLWFVHHVVKTLAGLPGGALSDRVPRAAVVAAGWGAYALAYVGFAHASTPAQIAALFVFYALYHGLAEGAERALVADLAPRGLRGRAFGWYHGAIGAAALPAGLLTGALWETWGARVALLTCAAFAAAAATLLGLSPLARRRTRSG
jgi:MFS family permease